MTALDVSVPFALGLVSSLHCSQMCGPIVLAYSLPLRSRGRASGAAHVAYNAGRLATYSLLGAIAGAAGGGMSWLGRIAGIERGAAIVAGCAMIIAAILMSWRLPAQALVRLGTPSRIARTSARLLQSETSSSKLILGVLLGFLPCGLVYAALLKAVDSGSAIAGATSMLAFGLGTSGALLAIGLFSSAITARFGRYANTFATASVMLTGIFLLVRGFGFAGMMMHHEHHI
jgi:sulfite exporter TauE/SafE